MLGRFILAGLAAAVRFDRGPTVVALRGITTAKKQMKVNARHSSIFWHRPHEKALVCKHLHC